MMSKMPRRRCGFCGVSEAYAHINEDQICDSCEEMVRKYGFNETVKIWQGESKIEEESP